MSVSPHSVSPSMIAEARRIAAKMRERHQRMEELNMETDGDSDTTWRLIEALADRSEAANGSAHGLVRFLYILLRDHLPFGAVESLVADHVERAPRDVQGKFSEPLLLQYAVTIASRISP